MDEKVFLELKDLCFEEIEAMEKHLQDSIDELEVGQGKSQGHCCSQGKKMEMGGDRKSHRRRFVLDDEQPEFKASWFCMDDDKGFLHFDKDIIVVGSKNEEE
ncbi:hypothetical protein H4219_005506 [Mycoemilia scoparia]|uniref:Uncharacterized protein n=1 Tax=Mycoemilia scoparia TaxID=417184 RepID=A0A9W8DKZ0_9FUNG|nr:hypothetical protein H4219_005506 [Mycoemilia scoparia]